MLNREKPGMKKYFKTRQGKEEARILFNPRENREKRSILFFCQATNT
jgi:hypothetical protein